MTPLLKLATTRPAATADPRENGRIVRDELRAVAGLTAELRMWVADRTVI